MTTKKKLKKKPTSKVETLKKDTIVEVEKLYEIVVDIQNQLNDIKTKLTVVNNNGQWACDEIEVIKVKLGQVCGRMGL